MVRASLRVSVYPSWTFDVSSKKSTKGVISSHISKYEVPVKVRLRSTRLNSAARESTRGAHRCCSLIRGRLSAPTPGPLMRRHADAPPAFAAARPLQAGRRAVMMEPVCPIAQRSSPTGIMNPAGHYYYYYEQTVRRRAFPASSASFAILFRAAVICGRARAAGPVAKETLHYDSPR